MRHAGTAAAIIAGGKATRFEGRDKSRLNIGGQNIIDRQAAVLQPLTDELFIVSSQTANDSGRFAGLPFRVVLDTLPGTGVTGSIVTALEATPADRVVIVACDMPFLASPLIERLIELAAEGDGAWVKTPSGAEPLVACYRRSAAVGIRRAIDAGQLRASALDQVLDLQVIGLEELRSFGEPSQLLTNINSPGDLSKIGHS